MIVEDGITIYDQNWILDALSKFYANLFTWEENGPIMEDERRKIKSLFLKSSNGGKNEVEPTY